MQSNQNRVLNSIQSKNNPHSLIHQAEEMKLFIASLLLSLLVLHLVEADQMVNSNQAASYIPGKNIADCGGACNARCQLSSRPNLCNRACGTCCARCKCVPKGTSGNLDACPCYASLTTRGGLRKCP